MHRAMIPSLAALALLPSVLLPTVAVTREADPMLAEMGRPVFEQYCASCHGLDARGEGPSAPALRSPPADLTLIAARRGGDFPDGEIARFIDGRFELTSHGTREMPIWGQRFTANDPRPRIGESVARGKIHVLVEYLRSVQRNDGATKAPQPGEAPR